MKVTSTTQHGSVKVVNTLKGILHKPEIACVVCKIQWLRFLPGQEFKAGEGRRNAGLKARPLPSSCLI